MVSTANLVAAASVWLTFGQCERGGSACAPSSGCRRSPSSTTAPCWAWSGRSKTSGTRCSRTAAAGRDSRSAGRPMPAPPAPRPSAPRPRRAASPARQLPAAGCSETASRKPPQGCRPRITAHHVLQGRPRLEKRGVAPPWWARFHARASRLAPPSARRDRHAARRRPPAWCSAGRAAMPRQTGLPPPGPFLTSKSLLTGYRKRSSLSLTIKAN